MLARILAVSLTMTAGGVGGEDGRAASAKAAEHAAAAVQDARDAQGSGALVGETASAAASLHPPEATLPGSARGQDAMELRARLLRGPGVVSCGG